MLGILIWCLSDLINMNLKLLPCENFMICTRDSISSVRHKLMEYVENPLENPQMILSLDNKSFRGVVSEYKFEIRPIYKSNFHAPIIIGKFESFQNETLIHFKITLRSHQYFLSIIILLRLMSVFKILVGSYLSHNSVTTFWQISYWVDMIFLSSIIGLNSRSYLFESKFAKAKLEQIFLP